MLSQKEKLNNIQELKKDILQRIVNNDELINVIDSIDPTLSTYLVLLTSAINYQDEVFIEKINNEWFLVKDFIITEPRRSPGLNDNRKEK